MEELLELGGVGRKTANVILANVFDVPGIVVDTHMLRISRLMGFTENTDPAKVEYDLMEIFSRGYYVDRGFNGSASLKAVLPVFIPEYRTAYQDLAISDGGQTMLVWGEILKGNIPQEQLPQTRLDMLAYCKLDTLAMVKIWEKLRALCA